MLELSRQLVALDDKIECEAFHEEVLGDLRALALWHDSNVEVIWRLARACFKNASEIADKKHQEILLQEGKIFFHHLTMDKKKGVLIYKKKIKLFQ